MKNFYLLFLIFPFLGFGQEKAAKLGAFSTLETNIGLDLAQMIRDGRAKTDYEKSQLPPGKYNYGFTAQIGVQPLNWFALGGGLRYSYIDPNYHLLYAMVQPKFFLGDTRDEEFFYLFGSMGTKINRTAAVVRIQEIYRGIEISLHHFRIFILIGFRQFVINLIPQVIIPVAKNGIERIIGVYPGFIMLSRFIVYFSKIQIRCSSYQQRIGIIQPETEDFF